MRVRIRDRKGKGKIVIEYATLEDFDRVVEVLKGSPSGSVPAKESRHEACPIFFSSLGLSARLWTSCPRRAITVATSRPSAS